MGRWYTSISTGKTKLAENFRYFLNNSHWLPPQDYFLEVHTHENIERTHSALLNTKNCESTSNKSILVQMKWTMKIKYWKT